MLRIFFTLIFTIFPLLAIAEPKAEILMDLRSGEILHSLNPDERRHPASITKLMTLYITFSEIKKGNIDFGTTTVVSKHAASRPPSKMNLKAGQTITIADLIRGTAVQSANDGASALAEAVAGNESAFVRMMNETARAMGMTSTNFQNPHGLTHNQQLSTARDLAILARRMYYDHSEHYGLFSTAKVTIGGKTLLNTNRRFLNGYAGATGLKTGYTRAAGYNLAATAERNGVPLLTVVLGDGSSPERFERTAEMMNWGFQQVGQMVAINPPQPLSQGQIPSRRAISGTIEHSPLRSALAQPGEGSPGSAYVSDIVSGHRETQEQSSPQTRQTVVSLPEKGGFRPILIAMKESASEWGVQIGLYPSQYLAEKSLLKMTLSNISTLGAAPPSVAQVGESWSAAYTKMSKRQAEMTCRTLLSRNETCAIFKY